MSEYDQIPPKMISFRTHLPSGRFMSEFDNILWGRDNLPGELVGSNVEEEAGGWGKWHLKGFCALVCTLDIRENKDIGECLICRWVVEVGWGKQCQWSLVFCELGWVSANQWRCQSSLQDTNDACSPRDLRVDIDLVYIGLIYLATGWHKDHIITHKSLHSVQVCFIPPHIPVSSGGCLYTAWMDPLNPCTLWRCRSNLPNVCHVYRSK